MTKWFIFTSRGALSIMEGETITKAVAAFRRLKHPDPGEIVGVIKSGAAMECCGEAKATPIFGVVCCVAEVPANAAPVDSQHETAR